MRSILSNRHFIVIVTLLLIAWGIMSFRTIPRSEDPQIEFTGSSIFAVLPGAGPEDIQKLVVDPIEEELNKLSDVNHLTSSATENVALINIEFTVNTDPDDKYRDVLSAIDNIRGRLPQGLARFNITKYSSSDVSILQYALVDDGDEFPVIIHSGCAAAPRMEEIERVSVPSVTGDMVPLRQIASIGLEQGPSIINHYLLERVTNVLADVESGCNTAEITASVKRQLEQVPVPASVKWKIAGKEESRDESFAGITKALAVALIGIFALLVLQFGNFSQPFIVFTAIPFAISGSIVALLITGYSFSFTAFIGFTSLMGIVVNNSIILIDCANQLRRGGMGLFETAIAACTQRFTPIVLTTVTTLLGLFPLILTGSSLWAPLAWVITGGLAVSMLLTLFVVPALYMLYTRKS